MANQKKFSAFAGVFTPSLLTILGVIMYMRMGWVVGNAGLVGTIAIVVIAHIISITTGLSISSIATDKKIGAGGVYYVLSRSLGLPIGGAIGVTLFTGTALSIALYLIGFAESFNAYLGLETNINGLRIGGSLALLTLTILALISTSLALKAQFFILAAIVISLFSIFFGTSPEVPKSLPFFGAEGSVSMETIFAVFFPAVTGFTAGIAMSGDLKDPKKSIPSGTLWAIGVGFFVYIGLTFFIFFSVDSGLLQTDNNVLLKLAWFSPAVVAGIWGATLSSALGGILGGPRILQAMSVDKITPRRFAKGVGRDNEPRNALFLTVIIAQAGILIGELDTIARICSMFYLAAYGFINLSFYLESWASSDFNPTFKVKKWIGLVGFIATFTVMFRLDMMAMVVAFLVIGGIYFWLAKKELALGSGDVWGSVWASVVKTGLRRMDENQEHKRNWKPNVLLFSGGTNHRPHLLEFSKELVGNRGIVTNFDLLENQDAKVLFPKHKQSVSDDILKKYGAFGRQIQVKNVFKGIETIASTFGFSGIEPNTILMGWAKNTKDPIWFAQMTQKLIDLDYNVLYLDYDERYGFRKYEEIDLWWRGVGNNAELMLNISKFLLSSEGWRNAHIRVILVDSSNSNKKLIEKKIRNLLDEYRVPASIKIIGNTVEKKPIYELMKLYSSEADLVLVGIPGVKLEEAPRFVTQTNDLVGTIGTTLLVEASSHFDDLDFVASDGVVRPALSSDLALSRLPVIIPTIDGAATEEINKLEEGLVDATSIFIENVMAPIQEKYVGFYQLTLTALKSLRSKEDRGGDIYQEVSNLLSHLNKRLEQIRREELPVLGELFIEENKAYFDTIETLFRDTPTRLKYQCKGVSVNLKFKVLAGLLKNQILFPSIRSTYLDLGNKCYETLFKTHHELIAKINALFEVEDFYQHHQEMEVEIGAVIEALIQGIEKESLFFKNLASQVTNELLLVGRTLSNELASLSAEVDANKQIDQLKRQRNKKANKAHIEDLLSFPANWRNNQEVIHTTIETNLKLTQANLLVNKGLGRLSHTLQQKVNERIDTQFKAEQKTIERLIQEYQSDGKMTAADQFTVDESSFVGIEMLLQILKKETDPIATIIQEEVNLMSKAFMEDFEQQQMEGMPPIALDLPKIVDFILESKLNGPVRAQLERYLGEVTNLYFNQINSINLLKYSLSESKKAKEINPLLKNVEGKFLEENEIFLTTQLRFNEKLRAIAYDLQMELETRYLAEHADNWSRYISVSKRKKGLAKINEQVKTKLSDWYEGTYRQVAAKRHESTVSIFDSKYDLKSKLELGLDFVNAMYPSKTVLGELPFYYKQLFQGKHLPVHHEYIGRDRALDQVESAIKEGRRGAILIVGKSSTGKTHFSDFIAHTKFSGKVYTIDVVGKQGTIRELHREMAAVTGKPGEMEQCLSALPRHSTIVLNDIEVWWNRNLEKDALGTLTEIIEKFSHKHQFILNTNLYAMEALSKQGLLQKIVTTTIMLSPVSKEALKAIILERHKVGGLDLVIQGEENRMEGKYFNQLINKIYAESDGNIGLGLQIWLKQSQNVTDRKIYMKEQPKLEMLKVNEDFWKLILYQVLINKNLSRAKLAALFGEDLLEETVYIQELLKAGILEEIRKNTFTLSNIVKPNVEAWLTNCNVLD